MDWYYTFIEHPFVYLSFNMCDHFFCISTISLLLQVDSAEQNFLGFALSILVMFGLAFLAASFILYPVAENSSKVSCIMQQIWALVYFLHFQAKHIQFVSGVHITSFWTSAYLWDLINAFVPIITAVILFAAFPIDSYRENIGTVFLLFVSGCYLHKRH